MGDLAVHGNDLVAATQGRALWVLDDVTPLRQLTADAANAPARLIAPAPAIRVRANENRDTPLPPETPIARNPPAGAVLDYVLKSPVTGAVTLEILDAQGATVRAFSSAETKGPEAHQYFTERWIVPPAPPSTAAGHHRFVWDLRYPPPKSAGYEFTIAAVDGENTPIEPRGPLAVPGRYTVRLTAGGQRYEQPLVVTPDPRTSVAPEVLAAKLEFQRKIVAAMGASLDASATVAARRKQSKAAPGDESDARLAALEAELSKTNRTLGAILNQVEAADAPPTATQSATLDETLKLLQTQLAKVQ